MRCPRCGQIMVGFECQYCEFNKKNDSIYIIDFTNNSFLKFYNDFSSTSFNTEYLLSIINNNQKPTIKECSKLLTLGKKIIKNGDVLKGIKLIKYTADHGYVHGMLLMGYFYDSGIGVKKDYDVATAYYNIAGASGSADSSYSIKKYNHYLSAGDPTQRGRAAIVAKRIYESNDVQ